MRAARVLVLLMLALCAGGCPSRYGRTGPNKACLEGCDRARFGCVQTCNGSPCQATCERDAARCEDRCRGRR